MRLKSVRMACTRPAAVIIAPATALNAAQHLRRKPSRRCATSGSLCAFPFTASDALGPAPRGDWTPDDTRKMQFDFTDADLAGQANRHQPGVFHLRQDFCGGNVGHWI